MKDIHTMLYSLFVESQQASEQARDNLFSANHRNAMKEKYGFTEAERIKIEDLI